MNKHIIIVVGAGALLSCKNPAAPVPPDWGQDCTPSDPAYIELANSTEHRPPPLEPGTTPAQARADAMAFIEEQGYTLEVGYPPLYEEFLDGEDKEFCGITLGDKVYITPPCAERKGDDDLSWVRFLRHEGTHAKQQKSIGAQFYLFYFAYAEARILAYEGPAYAESYDTDRFFGIDVTEEQILSKAERVYNQYDAVHIPLECYQQLALESWQ